MGLIKILSEGFYEDPEEEHTNLFDALMTDENAEYISSLFGCSEFHWATSKISESVYLYMKGLPKEPSINFKIRFSNHDDKHYSQDETLGTVRISDCARYEGSGLPTNVREFYEEVWSSSIDSVKYTFNSFLVSKFKKRMEEIIHELSMEE